MTTAAPIDWQERAREAEGRAAAAVAQREHVEGENVKLQEMIAQLLAERQCDVQVHHKTAGAAETCR